MGKLYLVRHSITSLNSDDYDKKQKERIRGWLDVPLSDDGWKKAEKAADVLRDKNIIAIFSSNLIRAKQTAGIISKENDAPVITTPLLRPWNVGIIEGMPHEPGTKIMKLYVKYRPTLAIRGGEPYITFYKRWKYALTKLLVATEKLPENYSICAVTHSRNIYSLPNILSGGTAPILFSGLLNPAGILEIDPHKNEISIIEN